MSMNICSECSSGCNHVNIGDPITFDVITENPPISSKDPDKTITGRSGVKYECMVCGVIVYNIKSWQDHIQLHLGPHPYRCYFCRVDLQTANLLRVHMSQHQSLQNYYQCFKCGEIYQDINQLILHDQKLH